MRMHPLAPALLLTVTFLAACGSTGARHDGGSRAQAAGPVAFQLSPEQRLRQVCGDVRAQLSYVLRETTLSFAVVARDLHVSLARARAIFTRGADEAAEVVASAEREVSALRLDAADAQPAERVLAVAHRGFLALAAVAPRRYTFIERFIRGFPLVERYVAVESRLNEECDRVAERAR